MSYCHQVVLSSAYLIAFLNLIRKWIFVKLNFLMQSQNFQSLSHSCFHNNSFFKSINVSVEEVCLRMRRIFYSHWNVMKWFSIFHQSVSHASLSHSLTLPLNVIIRACILFVRALCTCLEHLLSKWFVKSPLFFSLKRCWW